MKLTTIWTLPAMSFTERLRRTRDLAAMTVAFHLPQRVKYWAFIHVSVASIGDAVVTEQSFDDVLSNADSGTGY